MTPSQITASRTAAIRREGRAWQRAGVIDGPARAAIEAAYPSDGHGHAPAWRAVIFVITTVAITAAFGAFSMFLRGGGAVTWLFFGVALAAATEALERSSLRGNGAAGATSFWACVTIAAGFAELIAPRGGRGDDLTAGLLVAAVAFGVACWRWGFEAYGVFAAAALFLFLGQYPAARGLWIAAGLLLLVAAWRRRDRAALAPEHRAAMAGIFATAAVALYAAVNLFSVDRHLVESLRAAAPEPIARPGATARTAAAIATAIVPLVFLSWGIRTRRRLVLDLGAVFAALSLVTLRFYVHLAPLWVILTAAGAVLLVVALALHRTLRRAADGERAGFTARPLYTESGAFPAVAAVAGFTPGARVPPETDATNFTGGGGVSGGGGAAGSF